MESIIHIATFGVAGFVLLFLSQGFADAGSRTFSPVMGVVGFTFLIGSGIAAVSQIVESTSEVTTRVEEYRLTASANQQVATGEYSGAGNALYYAGRGTIDSKEVIRYIRTQPDDSGREYSTIITEDADKVRLYQEDGAQLVERRHITEKKSVLDKAFGAEGKKTLDYIELVIPKGSITEEHNISLDN